jgi:hypothetical protein
MKNPKFQIPNSKEAPSFKLQSSLLQGHRQNRAGILWSLEFGVWNFFGTWNMEFAFWET